MNRPSHYETKGKQAILYGNANSLQILLITALFLLNAALLLLADNFLIHAIPADPSGMPLLEGHISGEILSIKSMDGGYLILIRTPEGDLQAAKATRNLMHRYKLDPKVAQIDADPYIYDSALLDFTVEKGQITKASSLRLLSPRYEVGLLIGLCFLLTALERLLLQKLRGN